MQEEFEQQKKIIPKCRNNTEHFVASNGRWLPCCVFPTHGSQYETSIFNDDRYNINETNDIHSFHLDLKYLEWLNFISKSYYDAPKCCQKKCGVNASRTGSHNHEIVRYEK